jgi:protein-disulfide isomerase
VAAAYADTGLIRYVYYPMLDHGPTQKTYEAAECAGEQDPAAFWRIHDLFYEEQSSLFRADSDLYADFARRAGVADLDRFRQCLDSGQYAAKALDLDRARTAAGIRLRPSFSIDGQLIPGAQSFQQLSELIDAALAQ